MKYHFLIINFYFLILIFIGKSETSLQISTKSPVKQPKSILRSLKSTHPRLVANPEDFAILKRNISSDSTLKVWHGQLKRRGDKLLKSAPNTKYKLSDQKTLLKVSRQIVSRIYTLGLLYQLHGDKRYCVRAWQELDAAAKLSNWNPSHFLDVAEMTHAFAIGYDWFYLEWTPEQRNILRNAIIEKGLNEAKLAYKGQATYKRTFWIKSKNNWNLVCNGGIGMGALAIADTDPELSEYVLNKVLTVLPIALQQFSPDGAWNEGPAYWDYATRYAVGFLSSLETALGTDFGLSQIAGFSRTALFPLYLTGPTNKSFNFADSDESSNGGYQLLWLAGKYNLPEAMQFRKDLIRSPHALDLLWFKASHSPQQKELPLAAYFKLAEIVTMRSAWNSKNAWFVGFKAGDNKVNHGHLDCGSFVLDALGKRWAVDLGRDGYSLPNYFDAGKNGARWTYYRTRAEGHNTLVLNPSKQPDQNPLATTRIINFKNKNNSSFAIADLTPAYAQDALKVRRGIAMVKGQAVVIRDEIKADKPSELYWFMHTPAQVSIRENGHRATLTIDNVQLDAVIISPTHARFRVLKATPLSSSPQFVGIKNNENIRKLTIYLKQVQNEHIVVEFHPVLKKNTLAAAYYKALNTWQIF